MNARLKTFTADNYIMVPGFAIVELGLSANELLCYSLIYGFTQDGESEFFGSLTYIASALNVTKQNAKNIIDRLLKRGLLEKKEIYSSGVKFCHYVAKRNSNTVAETATPLLKQQHRCRNSNTVAETATPVTETATHNIINRDNIIIYNNRDNKENNAVHSRSGYTHDSESEKNQNLFSQNELDAEILNAIVETEPKRKEKSSAKREKKSTRESLCLFENSRFAEYEDFKACFSDEQYSDIDLYYYYGSVKDWSSSRAKMRNDWIATARNFMRLDADKGKLKKISERFAKDNRKIAEEARKTEAMNRAVKDLEDYFNGLNQ